MEGISFTVIVISSVETGQTPLVTVQVNVVIPTERLLIPELRSKVSAIVALPAVTDQVPVPIAGNVAASKELSAQIVWSVPATAADGKASCMMET